MVEMERNIGSDSREINSLISKVAALASRGIDGEKEAAEIKLNEICLKYGISYIDSSDFECAVRRFKYTTIESRKILSHCIWSVVSDVDVRYDGKSHKVFARLNATQYIEILERYKHYWKGYKEEKEIFTLSFIVKNNLGLKISKEPVNESEMEKIIKVRTMMSVMNDNQFEKTKKINHNDK